MKTNQISRFCPLVFRNGKSAKNRVVVPPMASETADARGFVTKKTRDHYARLTESGAGLIMVEYSFVHLSGRSEAHQLGVDDDDKISELGRLAKLIHGSGALAGLQLTHAGGKTEVEFTGGLPMKGPSGIVVPVKDKILEPPSVMGVQDIALWKQSFVSAARRASDAGFDIVELHAAHGYGLNQWLSPITNQRCDNYGGSLVNRSRLLVEIISEMKEQLPGLLISVRMPGQDFLEGGLTVIESKQLAKILESLTIDIINVSSGIGGWRRPRDRKGEGYLVKEAEAIQSATILPVMGVGGIETGDFIDRALRKSQLSLAAVGRAILADPKQWGAANLKNKHC